MYKTFIRSVIGYGLFYGKAYKTTLREVLKNKTLRINPTPILTLNARAV